VHLYLLTDYYTLIVVLFTLRKCSGASGIYDQNASGSTERFPSEVRAIAGGVCYHQGATVGVDGADRGLCRDPPHMGFD
jgi:hypothetical protein